MNKKQAAKEYQKLIKLIEKTAAKKKVSKSDIAKGIGIDSSNIYKVFNFKYTLTPVNLILIIDFVGLKMKIISD